MMERWKQRNSLNLDSRFGMNYIGKLFGSGNSNANSKSSSINGEGAFNSPGKHRHYAGLQPLSPCWELSDSFSHSRATSSSPKTNAKHVAKLRPKNSQINSPRRPYSICGPVSVSQYTNYSVPSPSQTKSKAFQITPIVELNERKCWLNNRWSATDIIRRTKNISISSI